jgi:hypothetical protein
MEKQAKIDTNLDFVVQFIEDSELENELKEAYSSVLINPAVSWAKFVLTDDNPNGNGQRIPQEEFANLIQSGTFMPIKMAQGEIKDGHEKALPLGVITHIKQEGNRLIAMAALWLKERGNDISMLKQLLASNQPVNVSWEILYGDADIEDNVMSLRDTILKAVTVVKKPAYGGRTPILAVAAKKWSPAYIAGLPDSCFLVVERPLQEGQKPIRHFAYKDMDGNIDPTRFQTIAEEMVTTSLPQNKIKTAIQKMKKLKEMMESGASFVEINDEFKDGTPNFIESASSELPETPVEDKTLDELELLKTANAELQAKLDTANALAAELQEKLDVANSSLAAAAEELASLKEFKAAIDEERAVAEKLSAIKSKFEEAGIAKEEGYFDTNKDSLLSMEQGALDFMIQEMVAFNSNQPTEASKQVKIPNLQSDTKKLDVKELGRALRERRVK